MQYLRTRLKLLLGEQASISIDSGEDGITTITMCITILEADAPCRLVCETQRQAAPRLTQCSSFSVYVHRGPSAIAPLP
ncbi:MAG: hypothetical protein ACERKO_00675 [Acetanaerobacterium sp.]